jgi:GNAT superfamily N-acetyltransferase
MLVAPTARRRGIGTALLNAGLARTGAVLVKADVKKGNEGSVRAVLAAGFTELIPPDVRDWRFFAWTRSGIPYAPALGLTTGVGQAPSTVGADPLVRANHALSGSS